MTGVLVLIGELVRWPESFFLRCFELSDVECFDPVSDVYLIISVSDGSLRWSSMFLDEFVCGMLSDVDKELDVLADEIDVVLVVFDRPLDPCESIS